MIKWRNNNSEDEEDIGNDTCIFLFVVSNLLRGSSRRFVRVRSDGERKGLYDEQLGKSVAK
jgi:hypothetical protein